MFDEFEINKFKLDFFVRLQNIGHKFSLTSLFEMYQIYSTVFNNLFW